MAAAGLLPRVPWPEHVRPRSVGGLARLLPRQLLDPWYHRRRSRLEEKEEEEKEKRSSPMVEVHWINRKLYLAPHTHSIGRNLLSGIQGEERIGELHRNNTNSLDKLVRCRNSVHIMGYIIDHLTDWMFTV